MKKKRLTIPELSDQLFEMAEKRRRERKKAGTEDRYDIYCVGSTKEVVARMKKLCNVEEKP